MVLQWAARSMALAKREAVLSIALLLAVVSACFVPPSAAYFGYIDWNTLALLFSLMVVMKGYQRAGVFLCLANGLLRRVRSTRALLGVLVFLPFGLSMVVTNDVALLTFVPFGLLVLRMAGQGRQVVPLVVMQTLAANLGSMLTPMGNPQNLYLYGKSGMGFGGLCLLMLPYVAVAGGCLAVALLLRRPSPVQAPAADPLHPGVWPVPAGAVPGGECLGGVCHPCPVFAAHRPGLAGFGGLLPAGGVCSVFHFHWESLRGGGVPVYPLRRFDRACGAGGGSGQPGDQQRPRGPAALRLYQPVGPADCGVQPGWVGDADRLHGQPHLL